ncbi:MAG: cold shock domain-containing protein [Phycisphaeraceae bacterium]|nr:cold shock domain-containing protein [Phycisphaeraceae bacterium]
MSEHASDTIVGAEGVVKWFDAQRGWGFIIGPQGQDIFVHFSVIVKGSPGFRSLRDGSTVEYDAQRTDRGWKATRAVVRGIVETPQSRKANRAARR